MNSGKLRGCKILINLERILGHSLGAWKDLSTDRLYAEIICVRKKFNNNFLLCLNGFGSYSSKRIAEASSSELTGPYMTTKFMTFILPDIPTIMK